MATALNGDGPLAVHGFLRISYDHYTPEEEANVWLTGRNFDNMDLQDKPKITAQVEKSRCHIEFGVRSAGIFTA